MRETTFIRRQLARRHSLPAKLLFVTVLFIIVAEAVVFIPSVAKFRYDWLQERIERAYLVSFPFELATESDLDETTLRTLFSTADILGVRVEMGERTALILAPDSMVDPSLEKQMVDITAPGALRLVGDALATMLSHRNTTMLVTGRPSAAPQANVDIVIEKASMRQAMWQYAGGILGLSAVICVIVAAAVYAALLMMFVRPMVKLTANMARFQREPEAPGAMMVPSHRRDEIGQAERVLAAMQGELRQALRQRSRLAALGEGVSKINHDLRNVLASAVLMSDRLASSDDPQVKKLSPRLVAALDRAVTMCRATLEYGRAEVTERQPVNLFDAIEEVSDGLKIFAEADPPVRFINEMSPDAEIMADRTQIFRGLLNLARNAAEALTGSDEAQPRVVFTGRAVSTAKGAALFVIEVADNGPGMPDEAREFLFVPFKGSVHRGGSGLGLAIAAEVFRAHGGDIELVETGPAGTRFRISLPL